MGLGRIFSKIAESLKSYTHVEKVFIFFCMICSLAITAEASITRSVSSSYFIGIYGPRAFPIAWIASLPLNYFIVYSYNRYIPKFGCRKMMGVTLLFAAIFNLSCSFFLKSIYIFPFLLHIWKDIFVIFMFHSLWSVINSTIKMKQAKYLYGLFYGFGGIGSVIGSIVPSFFAVVYGTEKLLLATIPLYGLIYYVYAQCLKIREDIPDAEDITMNTKKGNLLHGLGLIKKSSWLKFILFIVVSMQVTSTLLEYQFNLSLESQFSNLDIRTQFIGRLFGVVSCINIFLQFIGSFLLLSFLGLGSTHLLIPLLLFSNSFIYFIFPSFGLMCFSFGTIKSLDYTIFGIVKEMLYIPLKVDEKFQAKSIIDVFAYRSSKAIGAVLIFALTYFTKISIMSALSFILILIFLVWGYSVISMKEHFTKIAEKKPALAKEIN